MRASVELGATAARIYERLNAASSAGEIDNALRATWSVYGAGEIGDDEAAFLQEAADKRRPASIRKTGAAKERVFGALAGRLSSRFSPRQRPRSPDRQASRDRRRRLGGSSALPDTLRHHYTEGQRAVLCIIAGEVRERGFSDLPIDRIAALAGVCRTTVQTTLHEARRLGHLRITERPVAGRKHLPNLVEIVSTAWLAWIKHGGRRGIGSKALNLASTTKSSQQIRPAPAVLQRPERACERGLGAGAVPLASIGESRRRLSAYR